MQITLIGLGQVGASIGLALAKYSEKITLVGYDKDIEKQAQAKAMGAINKSPLNLINAVKDAQIIIISTPYGAVKELFDQIHQDVKPTAVILCAAPNKEATSGWFKQIFPAGNQFIGLTISFNPKYSRHLDPGEIIEKNDLFNNTSIGISAPAGASEQALKYASDLVDLLGAKVQYLDILEADGIERTSHFLPQVLSNLLVQSTINVPGWTDARLYTNQPYLNVASPLGHESPSDLTDLLLDADKPVLAILDTYIEKLQQFRDQVADHNQEELKQTVKTNLSQKTSLMKARKTGNWFEKKDDEKDDQKKTSFLRQLFFGRNR